MKKLLILIATILLQANSGFAQNNFYYKYKEKKLLDIDQKKLSVKFSKELNLRGMKNIVDKTEKFIPEKSRRVSNNILLVESKTFEDLEIAVNSLLNESDVISVQRVFSTKDEQVELYFDDEICVQFIDGVPQDEINQLIKYHNLKVTYKSSVAPFYIFRINRGNDALKVSNQIAVKNNILFAHPNFYSDALKKNHNPEDEYYKRQFNFNNTGQATRRGTATVGADIKMPLAWDISLGSSSIQVTVLDDGLDLNHEDISSSKIIQGYDFADDDNNVQPVGENAHGTNCSGLIAADHNYVGIAGISPNSKLQMMKIFDDNGNGAAGGDIARAIDSAWIQGADVLSNSWGYSTADTNFIPAIREALVRATTQGRDGKGCVVVFAAGNTANRQNNNVGWVNFPGNIASVITVGASDRNDEVAFYSPNSDPTENIYIDLVAPSHRAYISQIETEGLEIWSTDIMGTDGYNSGTQDTMAGDPNGHYDGNFGGTSAACPQVAGAAALLLAMDAEQTRSEIYDILISTADKVGGYNYSIVTERPGASLELGFGRLNVYQALKQLPYRVIVDQKKSDGSSYGTIGHWETNNFFNYSVPDTFFFKEGETEVLRGSQELLLNPGQKYKEWTGLFSIVNHNEFVMSSNLPFILTSQFEKTEQNVKIKTELLNANNDAAGKIYFKDPWLIDYADPAYGNNMRNQGMSAPFKQRTSPFGPDYTTSYNGDVYQGVFLRQGYDVNTQTWTAPYYSVKADQTQSTSEHGESVTWHFQNWSGTDVTFQNAGAVETPVVFNAAGATAEAIYKGHLVSNKTTATGPNHSRVLARSLEKYDGYLYGSGKKYICFMAYADGSEVWYSKAETDDQTTNGNFDWLTETRVSDGQGGNYNPSVATRGNIAYFTWAQKVGNTWHIRYRYYNNNNDSYYWSPTETIASFTSSTTPTPVIALTENPLRVMVASNINGNVKTWLRKNGAWQYAGLNVSGSQPAICANVVMPDTDPDNFYFGDIALVYTYNDDIYLRNWNSAGESWSSSKKVSVQNLFSLGNKNASVAYSGGTAKIAWVALNDETGSHNIYERGWNASGNTFSSQSTVIEDPDDSSNPSVSWDAGNAWLESVVYENGSTLYKAKKTSGWSRTALGPGRYPSATPHNNETLVYNKYNSLPYLIKHHYEAPAAGEGGGGTFVPKTSSQAAGTEKMTSSRRLIYGFGEAMLSVDISNMRFEGRPFVWDENNHGDTFEAVSSGELTLDITVLQKNDLPEGLAGETLFAIYFVSGQEETLLQSYRLSDLKPSAAEQREGRTHHLLLASGQSRKGYFRIGFSNHVPLEYTVLRPTGELTPLNKSTEAFTSGITLPTSYGLEQNYPNPFNPLTHIVFDLPQGSNVRLAVYDLTGRKVADLVNGYKEAGRYSVAFDASRLASGMYVYRLEAGKYSAVRRMLLMK